MNRGRPPISPAGCPWAALAVRGLISPRQASDYRRGIRTPSATTRRAWAAIGWTFDEADGQLVGLEWPGKDVTPWADDRSFNYARLLAHAEALASELAYDCDAGCGNASVCWVMCELSCPVRDYRRDRGDHPLPAPDELLTREKR